MTTTTERDVSLKTAVAGTPKGVSVKGLSKHFGGPAAVENLDLEIAPGEFIVLLGPSGCGKTTTMRCIAGLESPEAGSISIGDRTVFDTQRRVSVPANKRNIGMVFQSYAIWPHKTVLQNVVYPLEVQKIRRADRIARANAVLDLVGLTGFGDRPASRLSGGQMQRVALARSLVMRPDVLLLDEPLSNLDAKLRERLRVELRELHLQLGVTSIYVTHDLSEALALADRVVVMNNGKIEQVADPETLWRAPESRFVADFMGMTNIYTGDVSGKGSVVLRDSKLALTVTGGAPLVQGEEVSVCVRQDAVLLSDTNEWPKLPNVFPATVVSSVFLGTTTRYHLRLKEGLDIVVVLSHQTVRWGQGAKVHVAIPAEALLVLNR